MDAVAQALAASAHAASSGLALRNIGNVGIRIFGGRVFNVKSVGAGSGAGRTYDVLDTTAVPFDAIRVVTAFGQTASVNAITPTIWVCAKAVGSVAEADAPVDAGWTTVNFGGTYGFGGAYNPSMPPAASNSRRVLTVSDVVPVASTPRTDGGAYPLVQLRCFMFDPGAGGNVVVMGNGTQSFANWATHPSGRIHRMTAKIGQFTVNSQSGMTLANSAVENGSPIVGIIYYARGKVVNVAGFGDSITEGQGTYIGEGFGFPACQALSQNAAGIAYEWSNLGWAGMNTAGIRQHIMDVLATPALKFDIGVMPCGSPNDIASTIGASDIASMRWRVAHMIDLLRQGGMLPVVWTWLPSNTAIKNYGATDALRRALVEDCRTWTNRGALALDFDKALAGVTTGGQVQMLAGSTSDDIHPNDTGNAPLAAMLANAIRAVAPNPPGRLLAA